MAKEKIKEVVDKIWPKTKKELEKGIENTKKLLNKGERYLKVISDKSIDGTKKLSLSLKREKLYYNLGKLLARLNKSKWSKDNKINDLITEIRGLDKEIRKIK